jgi:CheY-like chemotaxis protein/DNA-binding XRE family transcriptional regulator
MGNNSIVSNSEIGAAIRHRRQQLLLSPSQLGKLLGISRQLVQRYEDGTNSLQAEKLQEIAHALSVPICYFFIYGATHKGAFPTQCNVVRIAARQGKIDNSPALCVESQYMQNHILLIDDDEQVVNITKLFLECEGYRNIRTILDSRTVIPYLKENEVSLIVLDLMMPHIMGNDLLRTINNDFHHIPVIVMTAVNDLEIAEECKMLGAKEYLVKPVSPERFLHAVDNAISPIT